MAGPAPSEGWRAAIGGLMAMAIATGTGCGGDAEGRTGVGGSAAGGGGVGASGGGEGGTINGGCPAGTKPDGGACLDPGVPEGACGDGFSWQDGGCESILPALPCPPGEVALPGDTACHPLVDCGAAPWGNIPLEADTIYVDASFVGTSDGTETAPYTSLEFGINSADANGLVAVAAGTYTEDIDVQKPVRVWGRCPQMVKVVGVVDQELSTIIVGTGAEGSAFHNLSIEGPDVGLAFSGSVGVLFENLWVHDTGHFGIIITQDLGETAYTIRGSLIEDVVEAGVRVYGADGEIEDTVVRDVVPLEDGTNGEGISVTEDAVDTPELTVRRSVVARTFDAGILLSGGQLLVEDSVVRDVEPSQIEGIRGRGIAMQYSLGHEVPAIGEVRRTVVSDTHEYGVFAWSSEALVEHVSVRRTTAPSIDRLVANGIAAIHAPDAPSGTVLTLRQSLFEHNEQTGVHVSGSDATIEQVLVRESLTLFGERFGRGIQVQKRAETGNPANATIRWTAIHDCYEAGVLIFDSTASIDDSLIAGTLTASDGQLGDGVDAFSLDLPTEVVVRGTQIEDSARVGVALFAAALSLQDSKLDCNAIDINGEELLGVGFDFENLGGNHCGCGDDAPCKLLSTSVGPPDVAPDP